MKKRRKKMYENEKRVTMLMHRICCTFFFSSSLFRLEGLHSLSLCAFSACINALPTIWNRMNEGWTELTKIEKKVEEESTQKKLMMDSLKKGKRREKSLLVTSQPNALKYFIRIVSFSYHSDILFYLPLDEAQSTV